MNRGRLCTARPVSEGLLLKRELLFPTPVFRAHDNRPAVRSSGRPARRAARGIRRALQGPSLRTLFSAPPSARSPSAHPVRQGGAGRPWLLGPPRPHPQAPPLGPPVPTAFASPDVTASARLGATAGARGVSASISPTVGEPPGVPLRVAPPSAPLSSRNVPFVPLTTGCSFVFSFALSNSPRL